MVPVPMAASFSLHAPNVTGWMGNTLCLVSTHHEPGAVCPSPLSVLVEVSVPVLRGVTEEMKWVFSQFSFNPDQFLDWCVTLLHKSLCQCRQMSEGMPSLSTARED